MPVPEPDSPLVGETKTLTDAVFDRLSSAIIDGSLAPGEILRDQDIARQFGVSRTPVREALHRLTAMSLVETVANRYTRVTEVDEKTIADTMEYTGHQAGIAMRMAIPRLSDEEISEAVARMDDLIRANLEDDADAVYRAARALVLFVTQRTGNRVFEAAMRDTALVVARNLRTVRPELGTRDERDRWYQMMRQAIVDRDAVKAEFAFRSQHGL
ncbi:GntR family transcriptional regulator [Microbacterium pseudoresistens]|uniref:DNA-binding GntR family transcriptional regulator n=1 Tax=Microbacterium pseudoresistens TaxID=640634 RepID=A0A7Y9EU44_9MICO|nr:GntR family transcriptional regulator [Microbacterium pseudoresistens]NYD53958.1 DNA-binding GntR family transcriptional regulator [Microbacterium pseudoresistens]